MKLLVTGARGFVGRHLLRRLRVNEPTMQIIPTALPGAGDDANSVIGMDITNRDHVDRVLSDIKPTHILHLAGIASPTDVSDNPSEAWRVNLHGTLNIAHALIEAHSDCMLIYVGSGLIYGESANSGRPLDEKTLLAPMDEYAATKAAADIALGAMARRGLKCIRLRPFNHTGSGQSEAFVIPAFAAQVARIEAGLQPPTIRVGNLDAARDFLDVRDVVDAYIKVSMNSGGMAAGEIFNVAAGVAYRIGDALEILLSLSSAKIIVEQAPERMRPSDVPCIIGDAHKLHSAMEWAPQFDFNETLKWVLEDYRSKIQA